jgi:hypothetical protein
MKRPTETEARLASFARLLQTDPECQEDWHWYLDALWERSADEELAAWELAEPEPSQDRFAYLDEVSDCQHAWEQALIEGLTSRGNAASWKRQIRVLRILLCGHDPKDPESVLHLSAEERVALEAELRKH